MKAQGVLIITGMHRSGTSLVSSLIQKAGVNMGDNLLPANQGNPRGHFEDVDFFNFHEKLLERFGQTILVQTRSDLGDLTPAETEVAQALIEQRSGHRLWGWKDPRTSLFLDFWHKLLPQARYLFVYRHPVEVVLSLLRRGGDLDAVVDPRIGLQAWHLYNDTIFNFYNRHPESCMLCNTAGITADIEAFIDLTAKKLDLPLQKEGTATPYQPPELTQITLPAVAVAILKQLVPEATSLYDRLESMADLPGRTTAQSEAQDNDHLAELQSLVLSLKTGHKIEEGLTRPLIWLLLSLLDPRGVKQGRINSLSQIKDYIQGIAWREHQISSWQHIAEQRDDYIKDLENRNVGLEQQRQELEQQRQGWMNLAEQRHDYIKELKNQNAEVEWQRQELEQQRQEWMNLAEQRHDDIKELENRNAGLEQQRQEWMNLAEQRQASIEVLTENSIRLEEQVQHWQGTAEKQVKQLQAYEARLRRLDDFLTKFRLRPLIRMGRRLGLL